MIASRRARAAATLFLVIARAAGSAAAPPAPPGATASDALAHALLKQLVEINTTDSPRGNVTTAAEAMAQQLRTAGSQWY